VILFREIIAIYFDSHAEHINVFCAQNAELLGAFAKIEKNTFYLFIYFACLFICLSVCLSVRMHQHGCHWADFRKVTYWRLLQKSTGKKTSKFG